MTALEALAGLAPDLALTVWLRGTVIIAAAVLLTRLWSRASAAMRHGMWALSFVALAVTPIAVPLVPHWTVAAPVPGIAKPHAAFHEAAAQPAGSDASRPTATGPLVAPTDDGAAGRGAIVRDVVSYRTSRSAAGVAVLIWLIGATVLLTRLVLHAIRATALVRRGARVTAGRVQRTLTALDRPNAHVVLSTDTRVPLASGLFQPTVVLPVGAQAWSPQRLQSVLAHELAHVARRDYAVHLLAYATAALYWPNPLARLAAHRLEREREHACDDSALRMCSPHIYAADLVEVARLLRSGPAAAGAALAMAGTGSLFERVRRIMSAGIDRRPLSPRRLALAAALLATLAAPVVGLRLTRPAAPDPFLFSALVDTDRLLRQRAAWALGEFESRAAVSALLERTQDHEPAVRGIAAWALGEIKDGRAVPRLAAMLATDDDGIVREMATLALGEIGTRTAIEPLAAAGRIQPALRPAVIWALGEIDHQAAFSARRELYFLSPGSATWPDSAAAFARHVSAGSDVAIAGLSSDDPDTRTRAAFTAGRHGSLSAVDPLLLALCDPSPAVRAMAVWALDEINPTRTTR